VPVGPAETCNELNAEVDEVVCLLTPESFSAIGLWYNNFTQTSDQEVKAILANTFPSND
jgi:putative phosphoribosyl transferase